MYRGVGSQSPSYLHYLKALLQWGSVAYAYKPVNLYTAHCAVTKATIYYLLAEANSITT